MAPRDLMPPWPPWPSIEALRNAVPLPEPFGIRLLRTQDFETLPGLLLRWYPRFAAGVGSIFLHSEFLRDAVVNEHLQDAQIFAVVVTFEGEPCGFQSFERQPATRTLRGRLGVLAPEARKGLLGAFGFFMFEKVGELVGAHVLMTWISLASKHQQVFAQRRGFQLSGVATGINCEYIDGQTHLVTEALFVKRRVAQPLQPLKRENLTHETFAALQAMGLDVPVD